MKRLVLGAVVVLIVVAGAWGAHAVVARSGGRRYLVRAIFDDASAAATDEDVRIAGANVGTIQSLAVTPQHRAAVTLNITAAGFAPFHANATCAIRPQSLIGEEYVNCDPGTARAPALQRIAHGPGKGSYLLPVTQTSSPIDFDIVQDISAEPVRESLAVIIDEFGTGLATRGADLNAVIRRADPALANTDRVIRILGRQRRQLAQLAHDSEIVLGPLARERRKIGEFVTQANTVSVASAQRAADIKQTFRLLPAFLGQLRPIMADLGSLTDQGTPLMTSLGHSAGALGQQFANLVPFAAKARNALIKLGAAAHQSQTPLVASQALVERLVRLGASGSKSAVLLRRLLGSLNNTGAIGQLMRLLFNGTAATNAYNRIGHYARVEALSSDCTQYDTTPVPGCSAKFGSSVQPTATRSSVASKAPADGSDAVVTKAVQIARRRSPSTALKGLLDYLLGSQR